jgi:energy-coupling factor transporter ATP-binding protein EcfA2
MHDVFIVDNNIHYNFSKWLSNKTKYLFIAGLSGSGKSTIARKLAKFYNAEYIELDLANLELKQNPDYPRNVSREEKWNFILKTLMAQFPGKKLIIEGCQLPWVDFNIIKDHAIILIGTSLLKSSYRSWIRSFRNPTRLKLHIPEIGNSRIKLLYYQLAQLYNRFMVNLKLIYPSQNILKNKILGDE